MPRKSSKPSMDGDGLLPSLLLFLAAGAYYFLSAQTIINRGFVHPDVRQMVGLMCLSDSSFCVLSGASPGAGSTRPWGARAFPSARR